MALKRIGIDVFNSRLAPRMEDAPVILTTWGLSIAIIVPITAQDDNGIVAEATERLRKWQKDNQDNAFSV